MVTYINKVYLDRKYNKYLLIKEGGGSNVNQE